MRRRFALWKYCISGVVGLTFAKKYDGSLYFYECQKKNPSVFNNDGRYSPISFVAERNRL